MINYQHRQMIDASDHETRDIDSWDHENHYATFGFLNDWFNSFLEALCRLKKLKVLGKIRWFFDVYKGFWNSFKESFPFLENVLNLVHGTITLWKHIFCHQYDRKFNRFCASWLIPKMEKYQNQKDYESNFVRIDI